MKLFASVLMALGLSTVPTSHSAAPTIGFSATKVAPRVVVPARIPVKVLTAWDKVRHCESGNKGWHYYPTGGLGIKIGVWREFGGQRFSSIPRGGTPREQIVVASRIQISAHVGVPDRNYPQSCESW